MKSYLTCEHRNQQSFTDYCLDCGWNTWMTPTQYKEELRKKVAQLDKIADAETLVLEKRLGITS